MTVGIEQASSERTAERVRALVDHHLERFLDDHAAPVADPEVTGAYRLLRRFILGGGKRIRPLLCYWGWRGAGGEECDQIISAASALELCHAGLLIHDDIMDGSELRRGSPTMHRSLAGMHEGPGARSFGRAAAILMGVLTLAWSDELLSAGDVEQARLRTARGLFDRLRTEVITGQYLDILAQVRDLSTVEQVLTVIRYKTAKYTVERPLQIGGALAGADPVLLETYSQIGLPLGEAFQLRDDVLGMFGDPAVTGKSVLDDLREGKHTILIAHAFQYASPGEADHLRAWHGNAELTEQRAAELREIVVTTGALARVEAMIDERARDALGVLYAAPIGPESMSGLAVLADGLINRTR
ncbi:polyprenyl synthetase family protein [Planotetraspora phitsanulokensis]|uniref:Geranylgeranyl pyrophosphate synthase n=1 Tax=Planotetraspora phitsanulokensis TaxID=575192 RepID=A0A8J3XBI6_9ACTN|nr:polyprenyl synthetase family protein [Planotetraspora phitsanulokensis]GII35075.1 geranylgeranyl pyrophosphate synthase [Planotetraspora phitsanulokensis]